MNEKQGKEDKGEDNFANIISRNHCSIACFVFAVCNKLALFPPHREKLSWKKIAFTGGFSMNFNHILAMEERIGEFTFFCNANINLCRITKDGLISWIVSTRAPNVSKIYTYIHWTRDINPVFYLRNAYVTNNFHRFFYYSYIYKEKIFSTDDFLWWKLIAINDGVKIPVLFRDKFACIYINFG